MSVNYGSEIYAKVVNDYLPKAESEYQEMLLAANDLALKTTQSINFTIENPEQVLAETVQSITLSLTEAGNVSAEVLSELQAISAEVISLLVEKPLQNMAIIQAIRTTERP